MNNLSINIGVKRLWVCIFGLIMAVSLTLVNHAFGAEGSSDKTIMAFGDSLVAGYGLKTQQAFPAQLEAKLHGKGLKVKVINAGVSGDTSADGLNRLEWNLSHAKPGYAILVLGANDMLRAIDPAITRENLQKIMEIFKAHKIPVLVAGMGTFSNLGPAFSAAYHRMYKEISAQYDAVYYPFYLDGIALKAEFNQEDRLHPNAAGVAVIVDKMLPDVEKLLKKEAAKD